jgi:UDP-3-O-[3-hydroxymyristoyl] N-acetylglucosamine deacetylase/3-hydroxyacyl-[acyl-carrier-protein] dehydratase
MRKPLEIAQTFAPPPLSSGLRPEEPLTIKDGVPLDILQVMKILPHRYPFLMVDKVIQVEGNKVTAIKNVTINEPFFQGHFPGHPIMPGVLQLEAVAQVAGILMMRQAENMGKIAFFMSAENVKWRKPVRPGDTLVIAVEMTKIRGKIGKAKGVCTVDGDIVSEADVTFMMGERIG